MIDSEEKQQIDDILKMFDDEKCETVIINDSCNKTNMEQYNHSLEQIQKEIDEMDEENCNFSIETISHIINNLNIQNPTVIFGWCQFCDKSYVYNLNNIKCIICGQSHYAHCSDQCINVIHDDDNDNFKDINGICTLCGDRHCRCLGSDTEND